MSSKRQHVFAALVVFLALLGASVLTTSTPHVSAQDAPISGAACPGGDPSGLPSDDCGNEQEFCNGKTYGGYKYLNDACEIVGRNHPTAKKDGIVGKPNCSVQGPKNTFGGGSCCGIKLCKNVQTQDGQPIKSQKEFIETLKQNSLPTPTTNQQVSGPIISPQPGDIKNPIGVNGGTDTSQKTPEKQPVDQYGWGWGDYQELKKSVETGVSETLKSLEKYTGFDFDKQEGINLQTLTKDPESGALQVDKQLRENVSSMKSEQTAFNPATGKQEPILGYNKYGDPIFHTTGVTGFAADKSVQVEEKSTLQQYIDKIGSEAKQAAEAWNKYWNGEQVADTSDQGKFDGKTANVADKGVVSDAPPLGVPADSAAKDAAKAQQEMQFKTKETTCYGGTGGCSIGDAYEFEGKKTASGVPFKADDPTVATKDRSIPHGTVYYAKDDKTGEGLFVAKTDSTGSGDKTDMDLSAGAMKELGHDGGRQKVDFAEVYRPTDNSEKAWLGNAKEGVSMANKLNEYLADGYSPEQALAAYKQGPSLLPKEQLAEFARSFSTGGDVYQPALKTASDSALGGVFGGLGNNYVGDLPLADTTGSITVNTDAPNWGVSYDPAELNPALYSPNAPSENESLAWGPASDMWERYDTVTSDAGNFAGVQDGAMKAGPAYDFEQEAKDAYRVALLQLSDQMPDSGTYEKAYNAVQKALDHLEGGGTSGGVIDVLEKELGIPSGTGFFKDGVETNLNNPNELQKVLVEAESNFAPPKEEPKIAAAPDTRDFQTFYDDMDKYIQEKFKNLNLPPPTNWGNFFDKGGVGEDMVKGIDQAPPGDVKVAKAPDVPVGGTSFDTKGFENVDWEKYYAVPVQEPKDFAGVDGAMKAGPAYDFTKDTVAPPDTNRDLVVGATDQEKEFERYLEAYKKTEGMQSKTLSEYFDGNVPDKNTRAEWYKDYGFKDTYTGTAKQNSDLLAALKGDAVSETRAELDTAAANEKIANKEWEELWKKDGSYNWDPPKQEVVMDAEKGEYPPKSPPLSAEEAALLAADNDAAAKAAQEAAKASDAAEKQMVEAIKEGATMDEWKKYVEKWGPDPGIGPSGTDEQIKEQLGMSLTFKDGEHPPMIPNPDIDTDLDSATWEANKDAWEEMVKKNQESLLTADDKGWQEMYTQWDEGSNEEKKTIEETRDPVPETKEALEADPTSEQKAAAEKQEADEKAAAEKKAAEEQVAVEQAAKEKAAADKAAADAKAAAEKAKVQESQQKLSSKASALNTAAKKLAKEIQQFLKKDAPSDMMSPEAFNTPESLKKAAKDAVQAYKDFSATLKSEGGSLSTITSLQVKGYDTVLAPVAKQIEGYLTAGNLNATNIRGNAGTINAMMGGLTGTVRLLSGALPSPTPTKTKR
jgi:hypothetical protein